MKNNVEAVPGHDHYWELWLSPQGQISYLSPSWYSNPLLNPDDILKDPRAISKIIHPEDLPVFKKHFQDSVENKIPGDIELRIIMPDQSIRWIRHSCSPFYDEQGCYTGTRGTNYDITERKHIESIIRAQRDLGLALDKASSLTESLGLCLEAAMGVSHVDICAIFMLDEATGKLHLAASRGATETLTKGSFQFAADSVVAQIVRNGMPYYLSRAEILKLLKNDYIDEKMHSVAVVPCFDKERVTGSLHVASHHFDEMPYYSRNALETIAGQIGGAVRRAQAEESLRVSEEKYRTIFENAVEGIFQTTPEGRILSLNGTMARMLGYESPSDLISRIQNVVQLYAHPEERTEFRRLIEKQGVVKKFEILAVRKDGHRIWIALSARVVRDGDGRTICYDGFYEDISERKRAEAALAESEAKHRLLVENSYDLIWTAKADGTFTYASPSWEKMLGYKPSRVLGQGYRFHIHPDDIDVCEEYFRKSVQNREQIQGPSYRVKHADGSWRWHETNGTPVFDPDGSLISYVGISRDITARKQAEEALRESENLYRAVVENTGSSMIIVDEDTIILLANAEFEKLSGYMKSELEGKRRWTDFVVEEDLDRILANHRMRRIDRQAVPRNYEFNFKDRENSVKYIFLTVDMIPGTNKSVASLVDITQRKQFEEEIRKSEAQLSSVVETSNAGIIRMDGEGKIWFANKQMAYMLGYTHTEFLSENYYDYVDPSQKAEVADNLLKLKNSAVGRLSAERLYVRKDGTLLWGYVSGGRLVIDEDNFHVVLVITDITQVKEIEKEKDRLEEHLRQSQKMEAIGTLAGGIAHDFNNILASMMGFTEIAIKEERSDIRSKYLDQVMKSCERAKGLVDRILTFSRRREQERKPVDVKLIVKETVSLLRATLPATIEIVQHITPEDTTVLADPTQVHQVIMNLCTNAAHAMRNTNGALTVNLSILDLVHQNVRPHPDLSEGPYVHLAVSDTGCGIDAAVKDRIFEPFFTTKTAGEGTGLGLSVAYSIVKSFNGAIAVTSEPNRQTTFDVYLPRVSAKRAATADKWGSASLCGTESILFVDDEAPLVDVAQTYFESLGYRVEATTSSEEAMRIFKDRPDAFDIVITDMTMPRMTGADLSREILKIRPDLPIILCTGYSDAMSTAMAEQLKIRKFVMKPVLLNELAYLVRRVLFRRD